MLIKYLDHVHSWTNSFTSFKYVALFCPVKISQTNNESSLTKDLLNQNATFFAEQEALWFANRSGLLSAAPRSLGIAAPSDIFTQDELDSLVAAGRESLESDAVAFSNGNANLAKGIAQQLDAALTLYSENKELPLEMNLGEH